MAWKTKNNLPMPQEIAYERIRRYGYEPIDPYKNNRTRMQCYDKEGYIIKLSLDSLGRCNSYQRFSPTCNEENFISNLNLLSSKNGWDSKVIGYEPSITPKHTNVICECGCGRTFKCDFNDYRSGRKIRCNYCVNKISSIEKAVMDYLSELNVEFEWQKKFKECKYKRQLSFDFYLPDYKCCIEVDGEQHYYEYSNIYKNGSGSYKLSKIRDNIKNKFCKENGILLIRLKYTVVRNKKFKEILKDKLNLF